MLVPPETRHCLPWEGHEVVEIGQSYFLLVWGWDQAACLRPAGKGSRAVIHQICGCLEQVSSFPLLHLFLSQEVIPKARRPVFYSLLSLYKEL